MNIPAIPQDLVDYLDEMYAHRRMMPQAGDSDRAIWKKVGMRELVDILIQLRKDQVTGADQGFPNVLVHATDAERPGDHTAGPDAGSRAASAGSYASPADRLGYFRR